MHKQKIVFIDDDQGVLDGLRRMLHDQEALWDMRFISQPMEALKQMRHEIFDAAVVDIAMPGMTGLELLAEVKSDSRTRDTEVIVLTGSSEDQMKRLALNGGASDLLSKPIQKEDLVARLRSTLRGKSFVNELEHRSRLIDEQLQAAQRMELMGSLMGQTANSLREVLTSMLWYGELTRQTLSTIALSTETATNLQELFSATSSAGERVRQLLDYILRLSIHSDEECQPCDICRMTQDVAKIMPGVLPKGVVVDIKLPAGELLVHAEMAQLFQLLLNLALFSSKGIKPDQTLGLLVESTDQVLRSEDPEQTTAITAGVRITVKTSRYWLSDGALQGLILGVGGRQWDTANNGADLAIARRIAVNLGGSLEGHADPQAGTFFTLHLPRMENAVQQATTNL